jgi:phytoene dehydrogenase-like protein
MADVVIIGGGLNGLVAATWLARQKFSVLVLERHEQVGGAAVTRVSAGGFHHATLSHTIGPISSDVMRALRLDRAGLELVTPDPVLTTMGADESTITFHRDHVLTAASIERRSSKDAGRWQEFAATMQRLGGVLTDLNRQPPPAIDEPGTGEVWRMLNIGRRARSIGRRNLSRLVRYMPMAVADLASEWFEHDLMQGAIAARAVFGHAAGPWSAGTGGLFLQRMADDPMPVGNSVTMRGGTGALTHALADIARQSGVEIRTGARVRQVIVRGGVAAGVALDSGEEIPAHAVVGAVAPRQVFETLVDPAELPPVFRQRVGQIRSKGVTAKLNLSLSAAPVFPALHGDDLPLRGRMLVAPTVDYIERAHDAAKYGDVPAAPWLEVSVPSVNDDSLAPAGGHVMSVYVHFVPNTDVSHEAVSKAALSVLEAHVPDISKLIVESEVITPQDMEQQWGLPGGHIFHGECTMDQWWVARPLLGWAHGYGSPINGLFLASAGTHPGGGLTGQPGLNAARVIAGALSKRRR